MLRRYWLMFVLVVALMVLNLLGVQAELTAVFIDVGAAECILIDVDGVAMLIDTGYATTWPHVRDVLIERGVSSFEYLVLTHPHQDHIGAVPSLLGEYPVESVILPPIEHGTLAHERMKTAIEAASVPTIYPSPGDIFSLGDARIIVYGPWPVAYENVNDWSIVVMIEYAGRRMLMTGDVEAPAEADMLAYADVLPLRSDVLKVAHHGSETSSTYNFIEAVSPRYAIVSCDSTEDREYPSVETAMTLYDCGVEDIFTTEKHGDVVVIVTDDGEVVIEAEADEQSFPLAFTITP